MTFIPHRQDAPTAGLPILVQGTAARSAARATTEELNCHRNSKDCSRPSHGLGGKPTVYQLGDNVVVKIVFDKSNSWVADWVFTQSTSFQNELLHHEQGHYNLVALIAGDLFVDLMLPKGQTFASASAGIAAIKPLLTRFTPASTSPEGRTHKVRIVDVLKAAGINP